MQSVTKKMDMQLPKPALPYEYRRMCSDKNCQSTRCYRNPMRPMYDCQLWSESEGTMLCSYVHNNENNWYADSTRTVQY